MWLQQTGTNESAQICFMAHLCQYWARPKSTLRLCSELASLSDSVQPPEAYAPLAQEWMYEAEY